MSDGAPTWVTAAIAGAAAMTASVGTYWSARRKSSGSIATTEAEDLWLESGKMRQDLKDEVLLLRTTAADATRELQDARTETAAARAETALSRAETADARREVASLRTEAADAKRETERWRHEASRYEEQVLDLRKQLSLASAELEDIHRTKVALEGGDSGTQA
jgi:chromosome segregation ATPase